MDNARLREFKEFLKNSFFLFQGWNNATDAQSSLETVLSVPNTVHISDLGYFEVAIVRPSGYNRGKSITLQTRSVPELTFSKMV